MWVLIEDNSLTGRSKCMVCASVREDNPRALAIYVQTHNHTIICNYTSMHLHCTLRDMRSKHWHIIERCNNELSNSQQVYVKVFARSTCLQIHEDLLGFE